VIAQERTAVPLGLLLFRAAELGPPVEPWDAVADEPREREQTLRRITSRLYRLRLDREHLPTCSVLHHLTVRLTSALTLPVKRRGHRCNVLHCGGDLTPSCLRDPLAPMRVQ